MVFKELLFTDTLNDIFSLMKGFVGRDFMVDGDRFTLIEVSGKNNRAKCLFKRFSAGYKVALSPSEIYEKILRGEFVPKSESDKKVLFSKILEYPGLSKKDKEKIYKWL